MKTETLPESKLTKKQVKTRTKDYKENGRNCRIEVSIRYDDECGNGHNSFAVTASGWENGRESFVGCCHDEIIKHFPDLEKYIKWHLTSSDGPMHYLANTLYHAKEISPHQNQWWYYVRVKVWDAEDTNKTEDKLISIVNLEEKLFLEANEKHAIFKEYLNKHARGPELESARHSAVWPDATLEQLQDKQALEGRLPALMEEFKRDMEELGFTY